MTTAMTATKTADTLTRAKSLATAIGSDKTGVHDKIRAIHELIDLYEPELVRSLPAGVSGRQLIALAKQHLREKPDLLECTPDSLMSSLSRGMLGGFEFGGPRADAYIVPFSVKLKLPGGKEVWRKVATCMESWRGLVRLVRNTGDMIREPRIFAVYEGEPFDVRTVDYQTVIDHQPDAQNAGRVTDDDSKIVAFYAAFFLRSGTVAHWMPRAEIDAIRDKHSQGHATAVKYNNQSIWDKHPKEMAMKTVIRQMISRGMLPVSHDQLRQSERAERIEAAAESGAVMDAVSWSVLSDDVATEPAKIDEATTTKTDVVAEAVASQSAVSLDEFRRAIADAVDGKALAAVAAEMADKLPEADKAAGRDAYAARRADLRAASDGQMGGRE